MGGRALAPLVGRGAAFAFLILSAALIGLVIASSTLMTPHPPPPSQQTGLGTSAVTVIETQQTLSTTVTQGELVTYEGTFRLAHVESGEDIPAEPVVYLETNGRRYRLIGIDFFSFADGTRVRVTGTLVAPSSWGRPKPFFDGDIYVVSITAL